MTERGHPLRFGVVVPPMWRSWGEVLDLFTRVERAELLPPVRSLPNWRVNRNRRPAV
jgi:hypothetical protein